MCSRQHYEQSGSMIKCMKCKKELILPKQSETRKQVHKSTPTDINKPSHDKLKPNYSKIALKIMESQGWKKGQGLGKLRQGTPVPILLENTRNPKDKHGFGY